MIGIRSAKCIIGNKLMFRNVRTEDAEFILSLRLNEDKSRHLSVTSSNVGAQQNWIKKCLEDSNQAYFVMYELSGERLGTVRLYDPREESFCWGSWLMKEGAPSYAAVESALIVYEYAFEFLGFDSSHFDVRKANSSVWKFHERFGAVRVLESDVDYMYTITKQAYQEAKKRYIRFLPKPICVEW